MSRLVEGPDGMPYYEHGDDAILSTAWGVGWASPSFSELLAPDGRPALSVGCMGMRTTGEPVAIGIATPWSGAAQLAGQLQALRDALPPEFLERWQHEYDQAYEYARKGLEVIRDVAE